MGLENDVRRALEQVKASGELKEKTLDYLAAQRERGKPRRPLPLAAACAHSGGRHRGHHGHC